MVVNDYYIPLIKNDSLYLPIYGGAGSGKSVFVAQKILIRCLTEKGHRFLILRKYKTTILNSVFKLLQDLIIENNLSHEFRYNKTERSLHHKPTGNEIITTGLDDPEKLKSIAGVTSIWIEEPTEFSEEEFDLVDLRLRGKSSNYKQVILSFNPISQSHWLNKRFGDSIYRTTYKDNYFIDEAYKKKLENLININPNMHKIYALGQWGVEDPTKLFITNFNKEKHVFYGHVHELYNQYLDVHLCFDFNKASTCLVIQHTDSEIFILKEYHLKGVDLPGLVQRVSAEFPSYNYIINGDASGRALSAYSSGNEDLYTIIKNTLNLSWNDFHVPASNPSHVNSRNLMFLVFAMQKVYIHHECTELINDIEQVEIDSNGSMDAFKKKNPHRSHWLDPFRYFCNAEKRDLFSQVGLDSGKLAA